MAAYFFDSSALVKRYVAERGSSWVTGLLLPAAGHQIHIANITAIEVVAALARRERSGQPSSEDYQLALRQFRSDLKTLYETVRITDRLIAQAITIAQSHALRGYDAVQLAAAVTLNFELQIAHLPTLTLISADNELNLAAQEEGLQVENPNDHL